jgi:predicted  nucleic acid-binding Zn-ribbon protein
MCFITFKLERKKKKLQEKLSHNDNSEEGAAEIEKLRNEIARIEKKFYEAERAVAPRRKGDEGMMIGKI